jgi:Na+-driven multidrug efflux pump
VSLVFLSLPIFVTMVSWVGMKVTDTAIVGHLGKRRIRIFRLGLDLLFGRQAQVEGSITHRQANETP